MLSFSVWIIRTCAVHALLARVRVVLKRSLPGKTGLVAHIPSSFAGKCTLVPFITVLGTVYSPVVCLSSTQQLCPAHDAIDCLVVILTLM